MNYSIQKYSKGDDEYICAKLVEYNLSKVPKTQAIEFEDLSTKIMSDDGEIIGGCTARMYCWNVVYIDILWIDEKHRGQGLGKTLLQKIEDKAASKGCYLIHLDTFDFQARDFYIKQGYEMFGTLKDCPKGHCRYYLQKRL